MNITCKYCDTEYIIPITREDYEQWKSFGGCLEDVEEDLEAWEREMLISSTCDNCWKKMFPQ